MPSEGGDYATYIFGLATLMYSTAPGAFQAFVVVDDLEAGAFQPCNSGIVRVLRSAPLLVVSSGYGAMALPPTPGAFSSGLKRSSVCPH